jgi:hypothetical protein
MPSNDYLNDLWRQIGNTGPLLGVQGARGFTPFGSGMPYSTGVQWNVYTAQQKQQPTSELSDFLKYAEEIERLKLEKDGLLARNSNLSKQNEILKRRYDRISKSWIPPIILRLFYGNNHNKAK